MPVISIRLSNWEMSKLEEIERDSGFNRTAVVAHAIMFLHHMGKEHYPKEFEPFSLLEKFVRRLKKDHNYNVKQWCERNGYSHHTVYSVIRALERGEVPGKNLRYSLSYEIIDKITEVLGEEIKLG